MPCAAANADRRATSPSSRGGDGADVFAAQRFFHRGEVDAVFEEMAARASWPRNIRAAANKESLLQPLVGIADVLRGQREEDLAAASASESPGQQVKQTKERALAAGGDGDVLRADVPAEGALQQFGERFQETGVALRRLIIGQHAVEGLAGVEQFVHPIAEQGLEFGNRSRVAAAEHQHVWVNRHGAAQVVHELEDAGVRCELLAGERKLQGRDSKRVGGQTA
jgi:hypothetical protein